jgi:hypothetical protein
MTEQEAKEKYCPIKWRNILTDGHHTLKAGDAQCSASACMMWVWDTEWVKINEGSPTMRAEERKTGGHCGLARRES